jgi:hypothetical protein
VQLLSATLLAFTAHGRFALNALSTAHIAVACASASS